MAQNIGDSTANYVDPAWDYLPIYRNLLEFQIELRNSIEFLSKQETATTIAHADLAMRLEKMSFSLRSIQEKLK